VRHRDAALQNSNLPGFGVRFGLGLGGGVAAPTKDHFVIQYSVFDIRFCFHTKPLAPRGTHDGNFLPLLLRPNETSNLFYKFLLPQDDLSGQFA